MGYHPRIECKKIATFQTTRTQNSKLWLVNNKKLETDILGYAAKFSKRYNVELYALAIEGNHIQFPARFPKGKRASFMRDFNSCVAKAVKRRQTNYSGGRLWARRYSAEYLPGNADIEEQFFYTVLQPVQDGLVDDISEYPDYNCFEDAISERVQVYPVVNWKKYNDARRWGKKVQIEDFIEYFELKFKRLPGYEALSSNEYQEMMRAKLVERTKIAIEERRAKKALGAPRLRKVIPGQTPRRTKTSSIESHRPRVLSKDDQRRAGAKTWYFSIIFDYRECSKRYRSGDLTVTFPRGTYKPPTFTVINNDLLE